MSNLYNPSIKDLRYLIDNIPHGILVCQVVDDDPNNITLIYANKASQEISKYDFQEYMGKTLGQMTNQDMRQNPYAKIWMEVGTTGKPQSIDRLPSSNEKKPYEIFNVKFYNIGNGCVVSHYTSIAYQLELQKKINTAEEKAKQMKAVI